MKLQFKDHKYDGFDYVDFVPKNQQCIVIACESDDQKALVSSYKNGKIVQTYVVSEYWVADKNPLFKNTNLNKIAKLLQEYGKPVLYMDFEKENFYAFVIEKVII